MKKLNCKAREMRTGDEFPGFGEVVSAPVIEDGMVWARIGTILYAFEEDQDLDLMREDPE